jgi:tRNA modification GTPase
MNADVSLCVLSLLDIKGGVSVPQEVMQLVTPNTVFLLNKVDLVPEMQVENMELAMVVGEAHSWRVSAATGDGMRDFLAGLGKVLHGR